MSESIRDLETAVRELGALPMPVPEPQEPASLKPVRIVAEVSNTESSGDAEYAEGRVEYVLEAHGYEARVWIDTDGAQELEQLRARVAELETERHSTNEALSDAAEQLRRQRDRITQLEKAAVEGRAALASLCHDLQDPGTAALGALYLLQQATPGTPMEPGETVPKVYRASHDAIVMGRYLTSAAAREHCESLARREWGSDLAVDWIEDDEDDVIEMTVWTGGEECTTGYVVTPLEVAAEYDPDGDE